jgi:hypothetical protein
MANASKTNATPNTPAENLPEETGDGAAAGSVEIVPVDQPYGQVLGAGDVLQDLYKSQRWVPADRRTRIAYPAPQEIVEPFLERLQPLGDLGLRLHVETSHPNSVQDPATEEMHTAYGRFLVEARIGDYDATSHQQVLGFVVALDVRVPEVQVYYGRNASACINLAIFRREHYAKESLLTGGEEIIYAMTERFVDGFGTDELWFIEQVNRLQATAWAEREINERIGRLYRRFLTKGNLTQTLNYAIKLLSDPNSRYAVSAEGTTTAWNFFSAMTQYVTDKAYVNTKAEKTLQIVEEVCGDLLDLKPERTN